MCVGRGGLVLPAVLKVVFSLVRNINLKRGMVSVACCLYARCIKTGSDSEETET